MSMTRGISYRLVRIYRRRYSHNRRGDRQEEGSLVVHTAAPAYLLPAMETRKPEELKKMIWSVWMWRVVHIYKSKKSFQAMTLMLPLPLLPSVNRSWERVLKFRNNCKRIASQKHARNCPIKPTKFCKFVKAQRTTDKKLYELLYEFSIAADWNIIWQINYRSGTVNSKSFVGKVFLWIKWKFKLN